MQQSDECVFERTISCAQFVHAHPSTVDVIDITLEHTLILPMPPESQQKKLLSIKNYIIIIIIFFFFRLWEGRGWLSSGNQSSRLICWIRLGLDGQIGIEWERSVFFFSFLRANCLGRLGPYVCVQYLAAG